MEKESILLEQIAEEVFNLFSEKFKQEEIKQSFVYFNALCDLKDFKIEKLFNKAL